VGSFLGGAEHFHAVWALKNASRGNIACRLCAMKIAVRKKIFVHFVAVGLFHE